MIAAAAIAARRKKAWRMVATASETARRGKARRMIATEAARKGKTRRMIAPAAEHGWRGMAARRIRKKDCRCTRLSSRNRNDEERRGQAADDCRTDSIVVHSAHDKFQSGTGDESLTWIQWIVENDTIIGIFGQARAGQSGIQLD